MTKHRTKFISPSFLAVFLLASCASKQEVPVTTEPVTQGTEAEEKTTESPPVTNQLTQVFYVEKPEVRIYQEPKTTSAVLDTLTKGDAVKGILEGAWVALSSGGYVTEAEMSKEPIGRKRSQGNWK